MIKSLDNKLLGNKTWETDPYTNKYGCRSILRYN